MAVLEATPALFQAVTAEDRTRRGAGPGPVAVTGRPWSRSAWPSPSSSRSACRSASATSPIPLRDVVPAIFGFGNEDADFIVRTLRLPRALTGLLVGVAFGLSGAIFQSLARNPLASPDIIGITVGGERRRGVRDRRRRRHRTSRSRSGPSSARCSRRWPSTCWRGSAACRPTGWCSSASASAAMLGSVTAYLLTRAEIFDAQRATVWLTGSLNGRSWDHVRPLAVGARRAGAGRRCCCRGRCGRMQLGDDTAKGLGVSLERSRVGAHRRRRGAGRHRHRVGRPDRVRGLRGAADRPPAHRTSLTIVPAALGGASSCCWPT